MSELPAALLMKRSAEKMAEKAAERRAEAGEPFKPFGHDPVPSTEATWLSEPVRPEERLTARQVLHLIPVWVWIGLGILVLAAVLLFGSTEPVETRVLPETRGMMPGLEAPALRP